MKWLISALLAASLIPGVYRIGTAQQTSEVERLYAELQDESKTDTAVDQLKELAQNSLDARQYLAAHLPTLIASPSRGPIWLNSVRLAGDLKISEAVPALVTLLTQPGTQGGPITFAGEMRLDDDPAGKALAEIGEPALTGVGQLLKDGDKSTRWRAALVLSNIDSTGADQLLRLHLPSEGDSHIKRYIQLQLEQHKGPKVR